MLKNSLSLRIQRILGGLYEPEYCKRIIESLKEKFGRRDRVCRACISKLLGLPNLREGDFEGMRSFQEGIKDCNSTLTKSKFEQELVSS